jgi:hypothetical protein
MGIDGHRLSGRTMHEAFTGHDRIAETARPMPGEKGLPDGSSLSTELIEL